MLYVPVEVAKPGKLPDGATEIPFEFKLEPLAGQKLYETYHGVFVNIQYQLRATCVRGFMAKTLEKTLEFIVEVKVPPPHHVSCVSRVMLCVSCVVLCVVLCVVCCVVCRVVLSPWSYRARRTTPRTRRCRSALPRSPLKTSKRCPPPPLTQY